MEAGAVRAGNGGFVGGGGGGVTLISIEFWSFWPPKLFHRIWML